MDKIVSVKIDFREKPSGIVDFLLQKNIDTSLTTLTTGDYIINNKIIVERKSAEDFVISIMNNRLFEQCSRFRRNSDRLLFIVEGNPYKTKHEISKNAIKGAILSILVSWQIPMIFSKNTEETAELLCMVGMQDIKTNNSVPAIRKGYRPKKHRNKQIYFLQGLPNIGPILAKRLLYHFDNIESIVNSSIGELLDIKGLGKTNANKIREFLINKT